VRQRSYLLKNYNNKLADIYDVATKKKITLWKAPRNINAILMPLLKGKCRILDLGIGTGQSVEKFSQQGHSIVGMDISRRMLDKVRQKLPVAKTYLCDLENNFPKLKKGSFDVVISSGVFEFIQDLDKVFDFVSHILKPQGYFCFTFEEFLPKSKLQKWEIGELGKGIFEPIPKPLSFFVYRRTILDIKATLSSHGLIFLKQKRFIAYHKSNKIPVIYRLILARHNSA
jgi:SAM-dependent methyltransferase